MVNASVHVVKEHHHRAAPFGGTSEYASNLPHAPFTKLLAFAQSDDNSPLAELYLYFQEIIMGMPNYVYWCDVNCRMVGANRNVLDLFGFKEMADIRGASFEDMTEMGGWTESQGEKLKSDLLRVIETGEPIIGTAEPPIPDQQGNIIYFESNKVPIKDRMGRVIGVTCVSLDVTAEKDYERRLAEVHGKKSQVDAVMNCLVDKIAQFFYPALKKNHASLVRFLKGEPDDQRAAYLKELLACCEPLMDFGESVSEFSKLRRGLLPFYERKFHLPELLRRVYLAEETLARKRGLTFQLTIQPEMPVVVWGDDRRLYRILRQLCQNAVCHTREGGIVMSASLYRELPGRTVVISVSVRDTGSGLPASAAAYIDEKYPSYNRFGDEGSGEMGLGLMMVKQFVQEMGGEVEVKSQRHKGTTFYCHFPFRLPLVDKLLVSNEKADANG